MLLNKCVIYIYIQCIDVYVIVRMYVCFVFPQARPNAVSSSCRRFQMNTSCTGEYLSCSGSKTAVGFKSI